MIAYKAVIRHAPLVVNFTNLFSNNTSSVFRCTRLKNSLDNTVLETIPKSYLELDNIQSALLRITTGQRVICKLKSK